MVSELKSAMLASLFALAFDGQEIGTPTPVELGEVDERLRIDRTLAGSFEEVELMAPEYLWPGVVELASASLSTIHL